MAKQSYWEKLQDPRWQRKRLEIMQRDGFACVHCGDSESTLNVHHRHYEKGRDPWDYDNGDLDTLCEPCHRAVTEQLAEICRLVGKVRPDRLSVLTQVIFHWLICGHEWSDKPPFHFIREDQLPKFLLGGKSLADADPDNRLNYWAETRWRVKNLSNPLGEGAYQG